jgi:Flagellar assembly protein T, C-terminal domain
MPDGDVMLGYVAPGASATTYAKVKMLPAATPPPATSPHDGTYTDSKMFYTVSGGKMFVTPIGGATAAAPGATAVAAKPAPVNGLVADVSGTTLIINIGTNAGLKVGSTLDVVRPRVIKDPTTHKDLKTVDTSLGSLTITSADATTATGKFTGTAPTKVGDTVKTPE